MDILLSFAVTLGILTILIIERRLNAVSRQFVVLLRKIDLVLKHLGIEDIAPPSDSLSANVQEIASDYTRKIEAIKVHREETGASLKEAKDAIEKWMREKNIT